MDFRFTFKKSGLDGFRMHCKKKWINLVIKKWQEMKKETRI
jgi:hypothetical protein